MNTNPYEPKRKPLVTVEFQNEIDIATGAREKRMFVKMYFDARDSGLLAALGDRRWRTLCALSTFMDENGDCYPSQKLLAKALGVSRQMANDRIQELQRFRFDGRPVVSLSKQRSPDGRWDRNVYHIHPVSGFQFGPFKEDQGSTPTMSSELDMAPVSTTVSNKPDTAKLDTNKNQYPNQRDTHSSVRDSSRGANGSDEASDLVAYFHERAGHPGFQAVTSKEITQAAGLIRHHGERVARRIVDIGVERASETNFRMRTFGAILQYVPDALESIASEEGARARAEGATRDRREEDARLEAERSAWRALPFNDRVENRLSQHLVTFRILHRREPTPQELANLRAKIEGQEAA